MVGRSVHGCVRIPWPWPNWEGKIFAYRPPAMEATFLSDFDMALDSVWDFSEAYTAEGLVYLGYQTMLQERMFSSVLHPWVRKSYLSVIDYEDPIHQPSRSGQFGAAQRPVASR